MHLRGRKLISRGVVLAAFCAIFATAPADVKITANVTVTGVGSGPKTETVTTCYKGNLIRTERSSTVSIYDIEKQTVVTFRKSDKTYRVLDLKKQLSSLPSTLAKLHVESSASVQPTNASSTIAGLPAKKYEAQATIKMMSENGAGMTLPTTNLVIEQWMTESVKNVSGTDAYLPMEQFFGPLKIYGGMEPIMKEFSKMKGLPLSSRITITATGGRGQATPIVTTTNVTAVSQAPLNENLFQVPKGYTLAQLRNATGLPSKP